MILLQNLVATDRTEVIQICEHQPRIPQMIPYGILKAQRHGSTPRSHIRIVHSAISKVDGLQLAGSTQRIVLNPAQVMLGVLLGSAHTHFFAQLGAHGIVGHFHFVAVAPEDNAGQVQVVVCHGQPFVRVVGLVANGVISVIDVLSASSGFEATGGELAGGSISYPLELVAAGFDGEAEFVMTPLGKLAPGITP